MKKFLKIIISILIVVVIAIVGGISYLKKGLDVGKNLNIKDVDVSKISDGIYHGKYDGGRWSNEVKVTVKDHKIDKIELVKDVKFKKSEVTEEILKKVIEKQNSNVDVVSGATVTSKAYLKSIENALNTF